jgi:cytidyltransferase-like protein
MPTVKVTGSFDELSSSHIQFLEEAQTHGAVHVLMWSDALIRIMEGKPPRFPEAERKYFLDAIRYVHKVTVVSEPTEADAIPYGLITLPCRPFTKAGPLEPPTPGRRRVLVTGCYDWLHTGHVRFFEEVAEYGDVYAVVGHDANIELLKGKGHPHFPEQERRYLVASLKYVRQAFISTGTGWLDAKPQIDLIKPDIYAVNEDGDKPEKRLFCEENAIEYLVLKRLPKPGLPPRSSTELRGF